MLSERTGSVDASLRSEIDDVNARYAQTIDDNQLEAWPAFFTEDATYSVIPRENVELGYDIGIMFCRNRAMMADRVLAIRKASLYGPHRYRHVISRPVIRTRTEEAVDAVTGFVVFQMRTDPIDFGRVEAYAVGEYRDVFTVAGGELLIAKRSVILDNSTVRTLMVTPL